MYDGAGLLVETHEDGGDEPVWQVFKTPLWRSAIELDTNTMPQPRLERDLSFGVMQFLNLFGRRRWQIKIVHGSGIAIAAHAADCIQLFVI